MTFGTRPPGIVIPFPGAFREWAQFDGEFIASPCGQHGWRVEYVPTSSMPPVFLGVFPFLDEAVTLARRWAAETGATFNERDAA